MVLWIRCTNIVQKVYFTLLYMGKPVWFCLAYCRDQLESSRQKNYWNLAVNTKKSITTTSYALPCVLAFKHKDALYFSCQTRALAHATLLKVMVQIHAVILLRIMSYAVDVAVLLVQPGTIVRNARRMALVRNELVFTWRRGRIWNRTCRFSSALIGSPLNFFY